MKEKLSSHAGRLFLLALGILLTSTAGHAAARMMAMQMAQGSSTFAFQLAVTLAALLIAAYIIAVSGRHPAVSQAGAAEGFADGGVPRPREGTDSPMLSAAQITQLRLPPGLRLDSHEAIMIASAGADRRIMFVNPAFARLTGYEVKEWVGRSADLLSSQGPLRMESLLWLDTEADGREAHWIARLHRGDGTPFCAEAYLHPVTERNGSAGSGHIVLVMTDVSSRIGAAKPQMRVQRDSERGPARQSA